MGDRPFDESTPGAEGVEQVPCEACGGSGIAGYVDRGMATDAGQPGREGEPVSCWVCGGDGWTVEPTGDGSEADGG